MAFNFFAQKTPAGHQMGECVSALQKSVRRGEEWNAMYFAREIDLINSSYLGSRLKIILSEDIGLADPYLPATIHPMIDDFLDRNKGNRSGKLMILAHVILLMCRAPKSRLVDDFLTSFWHLQGKIEIPDYAYDKHTAVGKRLGRGMEHFVEEASLLVNELELPESEMYKTKANNIRVNNRNFPPRYPKEYPTKAELERTGAEFNKSSPEDTDAEPLF